ncbi:MAG: ATP-binding cassette domain-containing protein, partial [Butyrivibrio sp.]|nr:ATP-binding cassette domain-containing protein [Butyrivibrio sp.]
MSTEKKKEKILDIKNLDITFDTTAGKVHVIRGINIDLYQGETVAIVGESGSGKSVTMRAAM